MSSAFSEVLMSNSHCCCCICLSKFWSHFMDCLSGLDRKKIWKNENQTKSAIQFLEFHSLTLRTFFQTTTNHCE
uniref:Ovule protein n=1 Tax=Brugia timori TaxID=42155 RepID=A0A0R3Q9L5_9BILA